ncbi:MAG: hypothetical protein GX941_01605 [Candidatus Methanofastidiosa archaeon]|nr:hypothetical protein [Candidatus Methanofastidiosa archaeon]HOM95575.1 hypothetical protein [Methanofastidiosum sp.]HPC80743.1 hypothetical protein [Methanofastidiosum sp.]HRS26305.1 hypothetical protein [Methanofastidiosum sp.]
MDSSKEMSNELLKLYLKQGNISLILDGYEDLFSDFDPRPYSKRTLSDDFILECKKAVRENKVELQNYELRLLVPKHKRKTNDETIIRKRLKDYFQYWALEKRKELKQLRIDGLKWLVIGLFLSILSTYLIHLESLVYNLILVITQPGGWFSLWTALDKLFIETRSKKPEIEFYNKMAEMNIKFLNY